MLPKIQMVVNRALAKAFQSAAIYRVAEEAVHKSVTKPHSVSAVEARLIDAPAFTVTVAKFIKYEAKKCLLDRAKKKKQFNKVSEEVYEKHINVKDGIPTKKLNSVRSRSHPTDISDDKQNEPKACSISRS